MTPEGRPLRAGPAIVVHPDQNLAAAKAVAAGKGMTVLTSDTVPKGKFCEVRLETFRGILKANG